MQFWALARTHILHFLLQRWWRHGRRWAAWLLPHLPHMSDGAFEAVPHMPVHCLHRKTTTLWDTHNSKGRVPRHAHVYKSTSCWWQAKREHWLGHCVAVFWIKCCLQPSNDASHGRQGYKWTVLLQLPEGVLAPCCQHGECVELLLVALK